MKGNKNTASVTSKGRRLYFTSDNHVFMDKQSALQHAECLSNKKISSMTEETVAAETAALATGDGDTEESFDDLCADF